jgi:hypothetical protein
MVFIRLHETKYVVNKSFYLCSSKGKDATRHLYQASFDVPVGLFSSFKFGCSS